MTQTATLSEHINTPISTAELERRWALVRTGMEERGLDVLLIQSVHEMAGGYVRWFSDLVVNDQPITIVFPRDGDPMTLVTHGGFGGDNEVPAGGDGLTRGVGRVLTMPMFPAAAYTGEYIAELAVRALEPFATGAIGVLGAHQISYVALNHIKLALPKARFVDASDFVDAIKVIKSAEEQELIRRAAAMQDVVMAEAMRAIEPGKRESAITAVAKRVSQDLGSESGILLCGSAPAGQPAMLGNTHMQNRVIGSGDTVMLLVEVNGPGGMYAEVGRTLVVGTAAQSLKDEFEFAVETQRRTVDQLRPGASCVAIWESHNAWMRENGVTEERRIHCHGQGYDFVERPLVRVDEPMALAAGMNLTCHPLYTRNGFTSWICDNYLIQPDGPPEPLHRFAREIVEV